MRFFGFRRNFKRFCSFSRIFEWFCGFGDPPDTPNTKTWIQTHSQRGWFAGEGHEIHSHQARIRRGVIDCPIYHSTLLHTSPPILVSYNRFDIFCNGFPYIFHLPCHSHLQFNYMIFCYILKKEYFSLYFS